MREVTAYKESENSDEREMIRSAMIPGNVYDIKELEKKKKSKYKSTHA
jgi:hypothetical protein